MVNTSITGIMLIQQRASRFVVKCREMKTKRLVFHYLGSWDKVNENWLFYCCNTNYQCLPVVLFSMCVHGHRCVNKFVTKMLSCYGKCSYDTVKP